MDAAAGHSDGHTMSAGCRPAAPPDGGSENWTYVAPTAAHLPQKSSVQHKCQSFGPVVRRCRSQERSDVGRERSDTHDPRMSVSLKNERGLGIRPYFLGDGGGGRAPEHMRPRKDGDFSVNRPRAGASGRRGGGGGGFWRSQIPPTGDEGRGEHSRTARRGPVPESESSAGRPTFVDGWAIVGEMLDSQGGPIWGSMS